MRAARGCLPRMVPQSIAQEQQRVCHDLAQVQPYLQHVWRSCGDDALRRLWLHLLVFLLTRILYVLINVHELIWPAVRLPWPCYFFSSAAAASTGALNALVYGCSPESALTACHERAAGCNLLAACQLCCPRRWFAALGGGGSSPKSWETPLSSVGTRSPNGGGGGGDGNSSWLGRWGDTWGGGRSGGSWQASTEVGGAAEAREDGMGSAARTPRSLLSAAASVAAGDALLSAT